MFDFEKNLTVDDLNTVPEQFRGLYEKGQDGKFTVTAAAKPLVEAYVGQVKTVAATSKKAKDFGDENAKRRADAKAVEDFVKSLGVEFEEGKLTDALKAHVDALVSKTKDGEAVKINMDKIKAEADKRINEAVAAANANTAKMEQTLARYLIDNEAMAAITASKGSVELLLPHVKNHAKVVKDGDNYVVRIVDAQGDAVPGQAGGFQGVTDFVKSMKTNPTFARAFDSEAAGGGGQKPGAAAGKTQTTKPEGTKNPTDKIASGLAAMQKRA